MRIDFKGFLDPKSNKFVAFTLIVLVAAATTSRLNRDLSGLLGLIAIIMAIVCVAFRRKRGRNYEQAARGSAIDRMATLIWDGELPELCEATVFLSQGEKLHFYSRAIRYITKNRVVGHTGAVAGASVRVAKGLSFRTAGIKGRPVYGDVTGAFEGNLAVTSQRMTFTGMQHSFECKLDKIVAISPGDECKVIIQTSRESYVLHIVPDSQPKKKGRAAVMAEGAALVTRLVELIKTRRDMNVEA
ncbi:MAG: hypothetical protein LBG71_07725 [Clostridiales Family XIII bacterium]|jgi:hypothetical protein|nr:hypothetical protein [Clostridiales Family XIII bacterium]